MGMTSGGTLVKFTNQLQVCVYKTSGMTTTIMFDSISFFQHTKILYSLESDEAISVKFSQ